MDSTKILGESTTQPVEIQLQELKKEQPDSNYPDEKETDTKERKRSRLSIELSSKEVSFEQSDNACFSKQMFNYLSSQQLTVLGEQDLPSGAKTPGLKPDNNEKCLIKSPTFEICWAGFIAFLLLLTIIIIPFEAAFVESAPGNAVFVIEVLIDFGFAIDIVLTFLTPYTDMTTGRIIKDHKQIAHHYLTRWFIFDLFSLFPVSALKAFRFFRLFRIFKFVKFVKMIRVYRYKKKFSDPFHSLSARKDASYFRLLRIWFLLFTFGHILACVWWYVGVNQTTADNWVNTFERTNGWNLTSWDDQYVASLYWALCTLTTVGYGDIHATNDVEMAIASLTMLASITFLAYMTGAVESLISSYDLSDQNDAVTAQKMMAVAQFAKDVKLPTEIRRALFKRGRGKLSSPRVIGLHELLPTEQERRRIFPFVFQELFLACPFLNFIHKRVNHDICWQTFASNFCPHLVAHEYSPDKYICEKGSVIKMLFFIAEGEIITSTKIKFKKGDCVGIVALSLLGLWPFDLKTTNNTKIFALQKQHFITVLEKMENAVCSHDLCLASIPTFVREWAEEQRERIGLNDQQVLQWKSVAGFVAALQRVSHKQVIARSPQYRHHG